MRIIFFKQWVKVRVAYLCKCGHKFQRVNTDYFTLSPFLSDTPENVRSKMAKTQGDRIRACPKCKKVVAPVKKDHVK